MIKLAKRFSLAKDDEMASLSVKCQSINRLACIQPGRCVRHRIVVEMAQMKTGMGGCALLVLLLRCLPYSNADNRVVFSIIAKIVTGTRPELDEDAIFVVCKLRCKLNNGEECREF